MIMWNIIQHGDKEIGEAFGFFFLRLSFAWR